MFSIILAILLFTVFLLVNSSEHTTNFWFDFNTLSYYVNFVSKKHLEGVAGEAHERFNQNGLWSLQEVYPQAITGLFGGVLM